jgi:hypothetical protein
MANQVKQRDIPPGVVFDRLIFVPPISGVLDSLFFPH